MKTKLGHGKDGAIQLGSLMMSFSLDLQDTNGSDYSESLPRLSIVDIFWDKLLTPWLKAQSEVPFHMWHRPSGMMTG
eukprot:6779994-Ditylum_brightwellii.AAC.1